jgi:hypothetical protein
MVYLRVNRLSLHTVPLARANELSSFQSSCQAFRPGGASTCPSSAQEEGISLGLGGPGGCCDCGLDGMALAGAERRPSSDCGPIDDSHGAGGDGSSHPDASGDGSHGR